MLAFVTSLPHPASCVSYRRRSELLVTTLGSVLGQRDPDIRVVVVLNEPPECDLPDDPRLEVVRVGFPPSETPPGRPTMTIGVYADKGAKLGMGTSVALRHGPRHVMFVDSDDFIHRDLAGFAAREPDAAGWYFDAGYFHIRGERSVTEVPHAFHQRNGTSHILRADLIGVPDDLEADLPREEVLERIGPKRAESLMGRHRPIVGFFEEQGTPLAPLPFPGAIWEIGTGENFTQILAAAGRKLPVAGRISEEFGLPVPSPLSALVSRAAITKARIARRLSPSAASG